MVVTVTVTPWPAVSLPVAGVTSSLSAAGTVIVNATGPPLAVSVNVPVHGPPSGDWASRTVLGDALSVPGSGGGEDGGGADGDEEAGPEDDAAGEDDGGADVPGAVELGDAARLLVAPGAWLDETAELAVPGAVVAAAGAVTARRIAAVAGPEWCSSTNAATPPAPSRRTAAAAA